MVLNIMGVEIEMSRKKVSITQEKEGVVYTASLTTKQLLLDKDYGTVATSWVWRFRK